MSIDNDAKKRSKDEALSVHIITKALNTRLNIIFESQITQFYGKPDYIIRLGSNLYIMVSVTRALSKNNIFTNETANALMKKKIMGLHICSKNLDCLIPDVVEKYDVFHILHVLSPNQENINMCLSAYNQITTQSKKITKYIKVIFTKVNYAELL